MRLTETMIQQMATPESFRRGEEYYDNGAVRRLTRRGDQLQAEVEGSQFEPYQVRITLDEGGIVSTDCTCPYSWGGSCKHIVATLLAYLHEPEEIEERAPVEALLSGLDREQLQALLLTLVEDSPDLVEQIEIQVELLQNRETIPAPSIPSSPRQRQTPLDPAPFRRQVSVALHSLDRMDPSEAYWHVGDVVNEVRRLAEQARPFIEAGDGRSALAILEAVTDEYVDEWFNLDDSDGLAGQLFADLGELWTEALLSADLTQDERQSWADRLTEWQVEMEDYGVDDAFDIAQTAALQSWDDPHTQSHLRGGTDREDVEDEDPPWRDNLTSARLRVLQYQGRLQEYLELAAAEGRHVEHAAMLVQLGRIQEAVNYGLASLATADQALALAKALREQGAISEALDVAEHGLTLQGRRASLARWLRDLASGAEKLECALNAALIVVREDPQLVDYQAARDLAGERWPVVRDEVLAHLRQTEPVLVEGKVDVLLSEGLVEDAIAAVADRPHQYSLVEKVADAAVHSHPDWVIRVSRQQAEPIMDEGKSKYYHHAVRWLGKARAAYLSARRDAEWKEYLEGLLARHGRKYSLVPMLQELR